MANLESLKAVEVNPVYDAWYPAWKNRKNMSMDAGEYFEGISSEVDVFGHEGKIMVAKDFRPKGFQTIASLFDAIKKSSMIPIPDFVWDDLDYAETTSHTTRMQVLSLINNYKHYNSSYFDRLMSVIEAIEDNVPLPASVILQKGSFYQILSGNRRLIAAKFHDCVPYVHIVKVP